jgi:hypothetical protein
MNTKAKVAAVGLAVLVVVAAIAGSPSDEPVADAPVVTDVSVATDAPDVTDPPVADDVVVSTEAPVVTEAPAPVVTAAPVPGVSAEYRNALNTASDYLRYSSFSRESLIGQIEYEGYPTDAAVYAVDNVEVDWHIQAALNAVSYLEYSSFSRDSLIDQLAYEGFTSSQIDFAMSYVIELGLV